VALLLDILHHHLIGDIPRAGGKVASRPKVPPPKLPVQRPKLHQYLSRCPSLDRLQQLTDRNMGRYGQLPTLQSGQSDKTFNPASSFITVRAFFAFLILLWQEYCRLCYRNSYSIRLLQNNTTPRTFIGRSGSHVSRAFKIKYAETSITKAVNNASAVSPLLRKKK
jgi:hypothetical protein